MSLTKEEILAAEDRPIEKLSVPEWGGHVYLRVLSGEQRDKFESLFAEGKRPGNIRARLAAMAVCNKEGKPIFNELEIGKLGGKSSLALDRVFDRIQVFNRLGELGIEDAEKNLPAAPSGGSGSG